MSSVWLTPSYCVTRDFANIVHTSGFVFKRISSLWLWTSKGRIFRLAKPHTGIAQPRKVTVFEIVSPRWSQTQSPNRRVQANIPAMSLGWFARWWATYRTLTTIQWMILPWVLAKMLVDSLLVRNHLLRATAISALQSRWISSELEELETLYERRINATLGGTT
jgi:hypothetical protein